MFKEDFNKVAAGSIGLVTSKVSISLQTHETTLLEILRKCHASVLMNVRS